MPKIIENLPQRLLEEARRQVQEAGYSALTIRSVAKACGVGVGTVYNYYSSKDNLVAAFMLEDWNACIRTIHASANSSDPKPVLQTIHSSLLAFISLHQAIFQDGAAAAGFSGSFSQYHGMLRSQLALPLKKYCADDFTPEFIAESLLTWTVSGKPFDEICRLVMKLL